MATLPSIDRQCIWRGLMRYWSNNRTLILLTKAEIMSAVNATDDWIDQNQLNYNNALPSVAREGLTGEQKTLLFCVVALARVSIGFLRQIIGEVN